MKVYGIRESIPYEIWDLIEFFTDRALAQEYADWLNRNKSQYYDKYEVEEIEVK